MTAYTLVGSRAIQHWFPDFRRGYESDYDYFTSCEVGSAPWPQGAVADVFEDARLRDWQWGEVATPDELYTIKVSHSFWEINQSPLNWNKHAYDMLFLKSEGAMFLRPLYDLLRPIWKQQQNRKEVNLRQTKDKFFADNVVRKYDHDSLHETVSYYDRPMYETVLRPGSEVDCDWDLFVQLDHEDKLKLCREEVYVTALERILIPNGYTRPRAAYHWALRRTITSLFKGEWALFMSLHLSELFTPDVDYRQLHLDRKDRLILL